MSDSNGDQRGSTNTTSDGMSKQTLVTLREISRDNLNEILALEVSPSQRSFVASNARSLAQALIYRDIAWFRAIYSVNTPVGFLMTDESPGKQPYLWRLMIDQAYQGRGYGQLAVSGLFKRLTQMGATELYTSCIPDPSGPLSFYHRLGFKPTGATDEDGEVVLKRMLDVA